MINNYKEKNRKLLAEKSRKYYQDNKVELSIKQRDYYRTHKRPYSLYKERLKKWRETLKWRFSWSKNKFKKIWELTFDEYSNILKNNKCHYCNKELNKCWSGLDRKNPNWNYSFKNVVPCCKNCNIMKNNFLSYEEMLVVWKALQKYWNNNK